MLEDTKKTTFEETDTNDFLLRLFLHEIGMSDSNAILILKEDFLLDEEQILKDPKGLIQGPGISIKYFPGANSKKRKDNLVKINNIIEKHEYFLQLKSLISFIARETKVNSNELFNEEDNNFYSRIFGGKPQDDICREETDILIKDRIHEMLQPHIDSEKNIDILNDYTRKYRMSRNLFSQFYNLTSDKEKVYFIMKDNHVNDQKIDKELFARLVKNFIDKIDNFPIEKQIDKNFQNRFLDFLTTNDLIAKTYKKI